MLQTVNSWDGRNLTDFSCKDIPNMKKIMLFNWAMSGKLNTEFVKLFGFHPGT
jgi:hypothetical protein